MEIFPHVHQIRSGIADRDLFQYLFVGAVVGGAQITVTNTVTQVATTNDSGFYSVPDLSPDLTAFES